MDFQQFINLFLCLIAIGALAVTGWFFITRGRTEILPNGKKIRKGKLFKGWYFFWEKKKGKQKIYFEFDELKKLHKLYLMEFPDNPFRFLVDHNCMIIDLGTVENNYKFVLDVFKNRKEEFETRMDVKVDIKGNVICFYKEYDIYVFPDWLRDPLATCATCFASIYGSIFYWGVIFLSTGLFAWTEYVLVAKVFFWVTFCLSLAVLNTALAKKFN